MPSHLPLELPETGSPLTEQQFAAAFEFAGVGMALLDTSSRVLKVNRALAQMLGRPPTELLAATLADLAHPEDVERDRQLRALMLAGTFPSYHFDKRYLHARGHVVWGHQTCTLVRDEQGRPAHFIVQVQDLSDRQAAEAALRESEERFRATFEQAALGIAHVALDGRFLRVNRRLCELYGYSREELLARNAHTLMVDEGRASRADLQRLLDGRAGSYTAQRQFMRKDGSVYPARVSVSLVRSQLGEPYVISFIEDISREIDDQRRIREQGQMLDQASDAIVVHEMDRRIRYWNRGAERLFGWRGDEAVGRRFSELLGEESGLSRAERHAMVARGHAVAQVRCRAADGRLLEVERRFSVIADEQGRPAAVLSVNTDITGRLHAQRELVDLNSALEDRIRQRTAQLEESNEELRTFAYSLAHDLRAPLAAIDGFSSELERRLGEGLDAGSRHYLSRVRAGVRMMSDLTDALLSLARLSQAPLLRQSVDLSALAESWAQAQREREPAREVEAVIAPTPRAQGDARLLADLLENLLGNAWKFSGRCSRARVEFGAEASPQGETVYYVRDNGAGFDPAYAGKLFIPFHRLHTAAEFPGTGIGLAIVRKIVTLHGGRIWAEAREGEGATFRFTLAAAPAAPPCSDG
jgi:PAS domain S-box-containing protein